MKCSRCQAENREGARFCLNCGETLGKMCRECGKVSLPSAKFCDICGHILDESLASEKVSFSHPLSYMPKTLADKILKTRNSIEGERKVVTVVFVDLANYTSIAEKLDPEEIHLIMDEFFKLLMDEIHRFEGTIIQFTGDGIMAIFGAPIAHEDHAQRACHAALAIGKSVKDLGKRIRDGYDTEFTIRTGINSGLVIVGSIGDDLRMDYTALGDTTNLASRMETMASPGSILVSKDTYRLVKDFFYFKSLGNVVVKGKAEPLEAFELKGTGSVETRIAASMARGLTKFVGRERELNSLEKSFESVCSGSGQVMGVVGEAGVGKSRLLLEFRNSLTREHLYLEGSCFHYGSSMAYMPVLDILRSYFGVTEGEQEGIIKKNIEEALRDLDKTLLRIQPPLHELFSLAVEEESYLKLEPKMKRELIFEGVRDLLVRESQHIPLVVAFEDLQWIDRTTEEFLSYLLEWIPNISILLILLYRPEYIHPWGNRSYYSRIGLSRLPAMASNAMVSSLLRDADVSQDLSELIIGRAGGNPLFMEEFTHSLLEGGYIKKTHNQFALNRQLWEVEVPDTVQGIIAARIDRLEIDRKLTMQLASVIGKDFKYEILEKITEMPDTLKAHLLDLQALEFFYEKSVFPEVEYTFKHALVQEVAYNSLLLKKRKAIHGKIAVAIEELYPERLEEFCEVLAYHYVRNDNRQKAYHYLKMSGMKAARSSALWEAFRSLRDAMGMLKDQGNIPENTKELLEIVLLMISPMISLGFPEDSLYVLQYGESLAREAGDVRSLTTLCSVIGLYFSVKGDTIRGLQYNEECFKIAEQEKDIDLVAPVAFDLSSNYASRGEFKKILTIAPSILFSLEEEGKQLESFGRGYNIYSALSAFYGFAKAYTGNYDEAWIIFNKGLEPASQIQNLYSLGLIELFFGYTLCNQGEGQKAFEHFEKSISYLEKGQIFVLIGLAWSGIGHAHYFAGNYEQALKYTEKGLQIHSDANISYNLCVPNWFLSLIYCEMGDLEKARSYVDEALRLAEVNNEIYYLALARITLGRILGKAGLSGDKAKEAILSGLETLEDLGVKPQIGIGRLCLAELCIGFKEREKAYENLLKAEAIFREMKMDSWLARAQGALHMFRRGNGGHTEDIS